MPGRYLSLTSTMGERIQLTLEIPHLVQTSRGLNTQGARSNAYTGAKLRFINNWHGRNLLTFPQFEIGGTRARCKRDSTQRGRVQRQFDTRRNCIRYNSCDFHAKRRMWSPRSRDEIGNRRPLNHFRNKLTMLSASGIGIPGAQTRISAVPCSAPQKTTASA